MCAQKSISFKELWRLKPKTVTVSPSFRMSIARGPWVEPRWHFASFGSEAAQSDLVRWCLARFQNGRRVYEGLGKRAPNPCNGMRTRRPKLSAKALIRRYSSAPPPGSIFSQKKIMNRDETGQSVIGPLPTRGTGRPPSATAIRITASSGSGASAIITVMVSKWSNDQASSL